ncbi:hypothetical protein C8E03_103255 [Lachnotalea glycerini]|uniref:Uncharacterized protein n=1 Tax=Lachnotalea glycerini TaxID=1763509 RepID=A0A318EQ26_9FIRM|nr:hypothetical protein [Lachnotalea glycerini]PXV91694.1 hypothetical protein C8E03_103255 [Lachnotalea glycerini]
MGKKKNYNKIPKGLLEKISNMESRYVRVGKRLVINKENIEQFEKLGIKIVNEKLIYSNNILPLAENGRYSKYNCEGRIIKRKDLPLVQKCFWGECYPYGNSNSSMVSYSYTKSVCQVQEWMPQFIKIVVKVESEVGDTFTVVFELDEVLSKDDIDFDKELLFAINLMQENIGLFEVYSHNIGPSEAVKIEYVEWELLPPGEVDDIFIEHYFGKKSKEQQREIQERYNFINSLGPKSLIKGMNYFSKYFGAKFSDDIVVLENIESGNAIYVFHQEWKELSKMSRTKLRKIRSDNVTRIVHKGNWKSALEYEVRK